MGWRTFRTKEDFRRVTTVGRPPAGSERIWFDEAGVAHQTSDDGSVAGLGGAGGISEAQAQALVDAAIADLTNGAPGALDTLNELAAALGDDSSFATTITNALAGKAATAHNHSGADVTSGTVAIARLPASLQAVPHGSGPPSGAPSGIGFYYDDTAGIGHAWVDGAWVPFGVSGGGGSDYIATVAAEANLLRYWPINEPLGSSSFHEELGGAALTGTVSCGQCILNGDVNGGAAGMSNPAHRLLNAAPFAWPAAWTMECWAFFLMNFANGAIFAQWDGGGAAVFSNGAGDVRAYSGGSFAGWAGSTNADLTGRHHVLLGHDGTNIKLFWDGVEKASSAIAKPTGSQGSNPILGGWNGGGSGGPFVLSDFAVYNNFDAGRAAAHYALATP